MNVQKIYTKLLVFACESFNNNESNKNSSKSNLNLLTMDDAKNSKAVSNRIAQRRTSILIQE